MQDFEYVDENISVSSPFQGEDVQIGDSILVLLVADIVSKVIMIRIEFPYPFGEISLHSFY